LEKNARGATARKKNTKTCSASWKIAYQRFEGRNEEEDLLKRKRTILALGKKKKSLVSSIAREREKPLAPPMI